MEIDASKIGEIAEQITHKAFALIEAYAREKEAEFERDGQPGFGKIIVTPRPTEKLLRLLEDEGLIELDIKWVSKGIGA